MNTLHRKPLPRMTADDFLDWPGDGTGRTFQLIDGAPTPVSPACATHGILQARIAFLLARHLEGTGSPFLIATEAAIAPRLRTSMNIRVPDLAVTQAKDKAGQLLLPDPVLLIEILSPSNHADTWENVRAYATIPSAREILVVHSTRILAELLRRQGNGDWPEEAEEIGPDDALRLDSIGFAAPLRDLYARTHLA